MILLLEGPDNGGKSTIMEHLQKQHAEGTLVSKHTLVNFKNMTFREDDKVQRTFAYINESRMWDLNIWDRCYYPSDLIYNPLVEKKPSLLHVRDAEIEYEMLMHNTVVLFVTANEQVLRARLEARGDEYLKDAEQNIKAAHRYVRFFQTTALPWYLIDTSRIPIQATVDQVVSIINKHLTEGVVVK